MNDEKRWLALELPPQTLNEIAAEALRLGSTPSALVGEAWSRSAYAASEADPAQDGTRIATRVVLETALVAELHDVAEHHGASVSALLEWAWQRQRGFYRTRAAGSLIG